MSTKLRMVGHNISLDFPISVDVVDVAGSLHALDLKMVLSRLADFQNRPRQTMPVRDQILHCCFSAYEYNMMTNEERQLFEGFVRESIGTMSSVEAARRLLVQTH